MIDPMLTRRITVDESLNITETIRGAKAPMSIGPSTATWSTRTPDGPASLQFQRHSPTTVEAAAWGPGSAWMLHQAPLLLGQEDNLDGFTPRGPLRRLWQKKPFILGRTNRLWDSLVLAILGQRVQTQNAKRSQLLLRRSFGEPAPGPTDAWILPAPATVAELGYHNFHPLGVERKRAGVLIRTARELHRLDNLLEKTPAQVQARLRRIQGIGPWTAAMVTITAMGDADAVPLGDFHIPNTIAWVLAGESRGNDQRMLELLKPYQGHRWRVIRLAKASGGAPKFGPRLGLKGDGLHLGR